MTSPPPSVNSPCPKVMILNSSMYNYKQKNKQHYSPKARVLIGKEAQSGDGLIAMDGVLTPDGVNRLASPKNNEEYARILYSALRQGDDAGLERIYIDPPEGLGLAVAIRDRITRASSS